MSCDSCRWWARLPADFRPSLVATLVGVSEAEQPEAVTQWGQCRRMPPRISEREVPIPGAKKATRFVVTTEFPDTPDVAWCGEWQARS